MAQCIKALAHRLGGWVQFLDPTRWPKRTDSQTVLQPPPEHCSMQTTLILTYIWQMKSFKPSWGAREKTQQLGLFTSLPENLGLVPSTPMAVHNHLQLRHRDMMTLSALPGHCMHVVHRHICGRNTPPTHTHFKNNKILKGKIKMPPQKNLNVIISFQTTGSVKTFWLIYLPAKSSIPHGILPQSTVFILPSRWYPKSKYREIIQEHSERLEDAAFQGMETDKNKKNLEEFVRKLMMEILFSFALFCVSYFLCGHRWFFQSSYIWMWPGDGSARL